MDLREKFEAFVKAVRKGFKGRMHARQQFWVKDGDRTAQCCYLGAFILGSTSRRPAESKIDMYCEDLNAMLPVSRAVCPLCSIAYSRITHLVMHLNDRHGLSEPQITEILRKALKLDETEPLPDVIFQPIKEREKV